MDYAAIINDIIGFIESFLKEIEKFFASIVKKPGYENPENFPADFQPTTEAAE
ncbi:MAG: hypothetical protein IKB08_05030 [Clostridia bacterium]|nr:hypothetical protein [Clostridia bacterium]